MPKVFTESAEHLADSDFKELPIEARLSVYQGLAIALTLDPQAVSDQEIRLLSWGYFRDREVIEAVGQDEWEMGFIPVWDSIKASGDQDLMWEFMSGDAIEDESLQVPLMATAIVVGFYGGLGVAGATTTLGGTATGISGAGAGVAAGQQLVARAAGPALQLAAKMTGKMPTEVIKQVALWGSGTIGAVGVAGIGFSTWNEIANYDRAQASRADAIFEAGEQRAAMVAVDQAEREERPELAPGELPQESKDAYANVFDSWRSSADAQQGQANFISGSGAAAERTFDRAAGEGQAGTPAGAPGQLPQGQIGEGLDGPPTGETIYKDELIGISTRYQGYGNDRTAKRDPDDPWGGEIQPGRDADGNPIVDPLTGLPVMQPGQYLDSDWEKLQNSLPEWKIEWVQRMLNDAGRITEKQMTGIMDSNTVAHLGILLDEANRNQTSWTSWTQKMGLAGLKAQKEEDEKDKQDRLDALGPFVRAAYLAPDMATLREISETAIEQQLGRKINDWEMQLMIAEQQDDYEEQHGVENDYARYEYNLKLRAIEEDWDADTPTQAGFRGENVDTGARFQQAFDERFSKELARKENVSDVSARVGDMMTGVQRGMRTMGG